MTGNSILGTLLLWGGVAIVWLTGESGRVIFAAGLGGLTRWFSSEKRRLRDGVAAVIGGAIAGSYLWPGVLWALRMDHTPDSVAMAAFVAGTLGISFVKVLTAVVEAKAAKSMRNDDGSF